MSLQLASMAPAWLGILQRMLSPCVCPCWTDLPLELPLELHAALDPDECHRLANRVACVQRQMRATSPSALTAVRLACVCVRWAGRSDAVNAACPPSAASHGIHVSI
ncbi:hypothetical protein BC831DRAFT_457532 [Entophlyctis helioformis]|nr:hypothetical protein BC831DRAFT_457532 [Entophlyctis helioformis]